MKKLFLTGGNGFLGKHCVATFSNKYTLYSPQRRELELLDSDAIAHYFGKIDAVDCVLHTAGIGTTRHSEKSQQECFYENLMVFRNVFQHTSHAKRFIHFGSGAEYAKPFFKENMCENDAVSIIPKDAYGLAKFFSGQFLESQQPGKFVNLRIFSVFGPYEDYRVRFISNIIMRSLLDLPIVVNQNGLFDYVYINDFLKILHFFIENPAPEISYNITSGQPKTLIELAEIVHRLTNNKQAIIVKNDTVKENYTGNNTRLLNFLPKDFEFTQIEFAISELIQWYDNYLTRENTDKSALIAQCWTH